MARGQLWPVTSALARPLRSSRWRRSQSSLLCKIPLPTPTHGSLPLRSSVWCALPSLKPARLHAAGVLGLGWRCAAPIRAPFGVSAAQVVGGREWSSGEPASLRRKPGPGSLAGQPPGGCLFIYVLLLKWHTAIVHPSFL